MTECVKAFHLSILMVCHIFINCLLYPYIEDIVFSTTFKSFFLLRFFDFIMESDTPQLNLDTPQSLFGSDDSFVRAFVGHYY